MTKLNKKAPEVTGVVEDAVTAKVEDSADNVKVEDPADTAETESNTVVVADEPKEEETDEVNNGIVATKTTPDVVPEKNVKIKPNTSFSSVIGGTRYFFVKDKVMSVPTDVKRILTENSLLSPL